MKKKRVKTAGGLKRELSRLVERLVKTPTSSDASKLIQRIGNLNVAVADAKRAGKKRGPKRKASPAQLRARAKFAAMAKRRGRFGRKARGTNPVKSQKALSGFQVAALKGGKILYLSGLALSTSREAASTFGSLKTAHKIARQLRDIAGQFGITKIAVVTKFDKPWEVQNFLLGKP